MLLTVKGLSAPKKQSAFNNIDLPHAFRKITTILNQEEYARVYTYGDLLQRNHPCGTISFYSLDVPNNIEVEDDDPENASVPF